MRTVFSWAEGWGTLVEKLPYLHEYFLLQILFTIRLCSGAWGLVGIRLTVKVLEIALRFSDRLCTLEDCSG